MRPDQERVRNLLIDTVTLLCKNSVQFQDELHVEGLLGVSVDKKDVFFVHISKEFSNSPSDGATVTQTELESQEEDAHPTENSRGSDDTQQHKDTTSDIPDGEKISIKTEAIDRPEAEDECLIVEDPRVKLEGRVSPAQLIAGQRRAAKRTSHSDSQQYGGDSLHGAYGMGGSGSFDNSQFGGMGEPPSKRRADDQGGDDYLQQDADDAGGTPWPSLAGTAGFDPSQAFQQDSDNSQLSMDGSQPGCSSWSTPGRGPSDSTFTATSDVPGTRRRISCPAIMKLEMVNYAKQHGNCATARKYNVWESNVRRWRKQEHKLIARAQRDGVVKTELPLENDDLDD